MDPIETDAGVKDVWLAALLYELVVNSMHTTPSRDECASYCSDANEISTIAKRQINGLVAKQVDCTHAKSFQAKLRTQIG